jgi:hypothetical protein
MLDELLTLILEEEVPNDMLLAEAGLLLSHLRSLHLKPVDFFFWGYINPAFYFPTFHNPVLELAARIQADTATITPAMLKKCVG